MFAATPPHPPPTPSSQRLRLHAGEKQARSGAQNGSDGRGRRHQLVAIHQLAVDCLVPDFSHDGLPYWRPHREHDGKAVFSFRRLSARFQRSQGEHLLSLLALLEGAGLLRLWLGTLHTAVPHHAHVRDHWRQESYCEFCCM